MQNDLHEMRVYWYSSLKLTLTIQYNLPLYRYPLNTNTHVERTVLFVPDKNLYNYFL